MTPTKHKGALGELRATAYLLKNGYEVFRNVSAHGPIDIVAINVDTGEIRKFDVKTGIIYNGKQHDRTYYASKKTELQDALGVELLVVTGNDVISESDLTRRVDKTM